MEFKRYDWIDFFKSIAIFAVVLDHCFGLIYTNKTIHLHTIYSVTLFIFLSGITTYISLSNQNNIDLTYIIKKIKRIFIPYFFATLIYCIYFNKGHLNIPYFFKMFTQFSMSGHFYFILFFIQLIIISPVIYKIVYKANKMHEYLLILILSYLLSQYFIRFTDMGNFYGGAKNILGGSYFFVFVLGIVFFKNIKYFYNKKINIICFCLSIISLIIIEYLKLFLKSWSNPPNKYAILYTITVFFIFFSLGNLSKNTMIRFLYIKKLYNLINILGKNSLYIFLYHLLFINIVKEHFNFQNVNLLLWRITILFCGIILPVWSLFIYQKIKNKASSLLMKT